MSMMTLKKLTTFVFNENDDDYIFPGQSWTYELVFESAYDEDIDIPIYYFDSTCDSKDFDGPGYVTLEAGSSRVKFNVNLFITDTVYEHDLVVRADFEEYEESYSISSRIVALEDCPWYKAPIAKGYCKKMIGLPTEYQEKYCGDVKKGDTFRYTGPECKDIYFWSENRCGDFFSLDEYPMLYLHEEC